MQLAMSVRSSGVEGGQHTPEANLSGYNETKTITDEYQGKAQRDLLALQLEGRQAQTSRRTKMSLDFMLWLFVFLIQAGMLGRTMFAVRWHFGCATTFADNPNRCSIVDAFPARRAGWAWRGLIAFMSLGPAGFPQRSLYLSQI